MCKKFICSVLVLIFEFLLICFWFSEIDWMVLFVLDNFWFLLNFNRVVMGLVLGDNIKISGV